MSSAPAADDFNGDGKSDILFQNSASTRLYVYGMNGLTVAGSGSVSLTPATGWGVVDH
jgi:hypothetical protein